MGDRLGRGGGGGRGEGPRRARGGGRRGGGGEGGRGGELPRRPRYGCGRGPRSRAAIAKGGAASIGGQAGERGGRGQSATLRLCRALLLSPSFSAVPSFSPPRSMKDGHGRERGRLLGDSARRRRLNHRRAQRQAFAPRPRHAHVAWSSPTGPSGVGRLRSVRSGGGEGGGVGGRKGTCCGTGSAQIRQAGRALPVGHGRG